MNLLRKMAMGGGYNLPFLLHLYDPDGAIHIYLINDNVDMEYNDHTYLASTFTYSPNLEGESTWSTMK